MAKVQQTIAELEAAIKATEDHLDDMWNNGGVLALVALTDRVERLQEKVRVLRAAEATEQTATVR